MDFEPLIFRKRERFSELEAAISAPTLYDNPKQAQETLREHSRLKSTLETWSNFQKAAKDLAENRELARGDDELAEMAREELPELEKRVEKLEMEVQLALLPPDPNEDRDAIVEIRAGTGGDEAGIFAAGPFVDLNQAAIRRLITAEPVKT